jgi:hypothetical protein
MRRRFSVALAGNLDTSPVVPQVSGVALDSIAVTIGAVE